MTIQQYEVLQCDVCQRTTQRKVDPARPPINKCNITYKCRGTLQYVKISNTQLDIDNDVDGLENWQSRTTDTFVEEVVQAATDVEMLTGPNHLTMAVEEDLSNPNEFLIFVEELTADTTSFTEFYFFKGSGTTSVFGADNSAATLPLRFTQDDTVRVYVNGVLLTDTEYDRSVDNVITFTNPLTEEDNNVRVIVYIPIAGIERTLTFRKNICDTDSAWGNVNTFSRLTDAGEVVYEIYTCNDLDELQLNSLYFIKTDQQVDTDDRIFLFSYSPHSSYDRDYNFIVSLQDLIESESRIIYDTDIYSNASMQIDRDAVTEIFPPISNIIELCAPDSGETTKSSFSVEIRDTEKIS